MMISTKQKLIEKNQIIKFKTRSKKEILVNKLFLLLVIVYVSVFGLPWRYANKLMLANQYL